MSYKLHIGRPVGFALEAPDIATQLLMLGYAAGVSNGMELRRRAVVEFLGGNAPPEMLESRTEFFHLSMTHRCRERIPAARNLIVADAREDRATHLLMLDPDVAMDQYVGRESWAKPWLTTFWEFILAHPGSVLAAPYCGRGFDPPVQVFYGGTAEGERKRFTWEEAGQRSGWEQVSAVGTGLMLIDMTVFDRIATPYFMDHYSDETCTRLDYTPDIWFCEQCAKAGVPVYVNWDCWVGHWQNQIVPCPRAGYKERPHGNGKPTREIPENGRAAEGSRRGCLRPEGGPLASSGVFHAP